MCKKPLQHIFKTVKMADMYDSLDYLIMFALLSVFHAVGATLKGPFDICEVDVFNATCQSGEMIIMKSAMYGRMSLGTCIKQHFTSRNCDVDVLHILDGYCSGLQSCVVMPNARALLKVKPCPEHSAYLSVSYECIKGGSKNSQYCRHESQIESGSGYLSSGLVQTNGEGTQWCPWTLSNSGHQRFNITLFKFTPFESSPLTSSSSVCFEIGTIQEGSLSQGILSCGGDARTKTVYISKGGPVKLYFKDKNFLKDLGTFVFHFNLLDCSEPALPQYATFTRDVNKGTVACQNGDSTWDIECQNGEWIGEYGTCDVADAGAETSVLQWIKLNATYSIGMLAFVTIGCALVIFLGGFCIYVTYFYATRQHRQNSEASTYNVDIYKLQTMQRLKQQTPMPTYERTTSLRASQATLKRNSDYQKMNPIDPETASHHSYVLYDHVPKPLPPIPIDVEKKHIYETPLKDDS